MVQSYMEQMGNPFIRNISYTYRNPQRIGNEVCKDSFGFNVVDEYTGYICGCIYLGQADRMDREEDEYEESRMMSRA